jgi:hypothetical protein
MVPLTRHRHWAALLWRRLIGIEVFPRNGYVQLINKFVTCENYVRNCCAKQASELASS